MGQFDVTEALLYRVELIGGKEANADGWMWSGCRSAVMRIGTI